MVLITGASGFIGSSIFQALIARGRLVFGITSNPKAVNNSKMILTGYKGSDLVEIIRAYRPKVIIHAAGSASVFESIQNPLKDHASSVDLYTKLLDAVLISRIKTRVLFISSAAVYGNAGNGPLSEHINCFPISPYGINKMQCEDLGKFYFEKYGIENISLRVFSTFGETQKRLLIWDIFQKYFDSEENVLYGSGNEVRDFIHIDQLVEQILSIADLPMVNNGAINLGSEYPRTVSELTNDIANILNKRNSFKFNGKFRAGDPISLCPDLTKFKELTGRKESDYFYLNLKKTIEAWC